MSLNAVAHILQCYTHQSARFSRSDACKRAELEPLADKTKRYGPLALKLREKSRVVRGFPGSDPIGSGNSISIRHEYIDLGFQGFCPTPNIKEVRANQNFGKT